MLVTDGNGLPLGFTLGSANAAEVTLAPEALQSVGVMTPRGRCKTRPRRLVADRAYDSRAFRAGLRRRGIQVCIPPRRRHPSWKKRRGRPVSYSRKAYAQRFKVERCFAWMGNFRRLLIRWEHHLHIYRAFCFFALALICLNALLK